MISFHPHGSLEHLPLCLSPPEPGGNKDQLLLRCPGHAAPEMNWKESSPSLSTPLPSVRLLLSPTPFPKFFLLSFPFTPLFNSSLVHLNQVFTKPIPCDRHTVRHSGYNSQQAWLSGPSHTIYPLSQDHRRGQGPPTDEGDKVPACLLIFPKH